MIVYIGHIMNVTDDKFCIVCPVLIYSFWLAILLSVLGFMTSDWPLYCLSCFYLQLLISHCMVCTSWIYGFWLAIVLSVLFWFTASDWPFYCLSLDLRLLITPLALVYLHIFKLFFGHYKKTCTFSTNHLVVQSIYGKKWPNLKLIAKELNSRFSCAKISSQYHIKNELGIPPPWI